MNEVRPIKVAILLAGITYAVTTLILIANGKGIIYSVFVSTVPTVGLVMTAWIGLAILSILGLAIEPFLKPIWKLLEPLQKWLKS